MEKFLSNPEIAGFLRNNFRVSLVIRAPGVELLFRLGGEISLPNLEKLRIPVCGARESDSDS